MNKRLILFFIIVFAILIGYNHFVIKPYIKQKEKEVSSKKKAEIKQKIVSPVEKDKKISPKTEIKIPSNEISIETGEKLTSVYTDKFSIKITNKGGVFKSIKIEKYHDEFNEPIEMIPTFSELKIHPFSVSFDDPKATELENNALYTVKEEIIYDNKNKKNKLVSLTFNDGNGNFFKKTFLFTDTYLIKFKGTFFYNYKILHPTVYWAPGIQAMTLKQKKSYGWSYKEAKGVSWAANKIEIFRKKIISNPINLQNVEWAGIHNNYFLIAFIPQAKSNKAIYNLPQYSIAPEITDNLINTGIKMEDDTVNLELYIGPKDIEILRPIGHNLTEAIDYGFFGFIAKVLLEALKFIYKYIHNYGIAIILLTILIKIIFYPLTYRSMQSMEKMKKIQPQVQAIREKYKKIPFSDPRTQKMNQEIMELYRKNGINPTSGCLPLLLQLPVLWGFYSLLSVAIEIRGQPFFLWIKDLSKPDPYYITPILMGISMLWQQKITPSGTDPMQQKLMMLMPIFFTFLFLNAQSGLVIYWLFNNILSIIQQVYFTNPSNSKEERSNKKIKKKRK